MNHSLLPSPHIAAQYSEARLLKILSLALAVMCGNDFALGQPPVQPKEDVFAAAVRTTEPLSPAEELQQFRVPDGFEVTLFASEPQLQKPLNMAFDADGRLWVSGSNEYPYPADEGKGRDSIRILKDTNGDGTADSVTVFADNLNIPMGLYPYKDGAIVFTIPNIVFLRDTNNDGKADKREVLYGPFDTTRDTHGMNNAFRRGFDGWLYCCHGFNNQSVVSGKDGHTVKLNSGNTYRIRLDGSRIEHFTHGQVNPFGMAIDANGDIFNSDCHTKPVSLLLRGGYYESFGKPHDGIGFVPSVMDHLHGSTAIDALCQYQATEFPEEFHNNIFVGNVMTSRIHRNKIERSGSSVRMIQQPDLLASGDPWFRPVDIQVGPDGALYVADFYNRIIGHYEVPLDHPGRDRERGRIWRVAYKPNKPTQTTNTPTSLATADLSVLLSSLKDSKKPIRQHAADQIVDRIGLTAVNEVAEALNSSLAKEDQIDAPQLLWILHRLNAATPGTLVDAYNNGTERTRIHALRVCSEFVDKAAILQLVKNGLRDSSQLVQRAAADAASQTADITIFKEVINAIVVCPPDDPHLKHMLKIALQKQLSDSAVSSWLATSTPPKSACLAISEVIAALDGPSAGAISVNLLTSGHLKPDQTETVLQHATANVSAESVVQLFSYAKSLPGESTALKTKIWLAIQEALKSRRLAELDGFLEWSSELASTVLSNVDLRKQSWGRYSLDGRPIGDWGFERRRTLATSEETALFYSSLPGGEKAVGLLRSRPFVLPINLKFQLCGHLGLPTDAPSPENRIVLRDFATGQEIHSALAPRSDVAETHTWPTGIFAGQKAYIEVVDGISMNAYAWIAFSPFRPRVVDVPSQSRQSSAGLAEALRILQHQQAAGIELPANQLEKVSELVLSIQIDGNIRMLAAKTLLAIQKKTELTTVADLLRFSSLPRTADIAICDYCINAKVNLHEDDTSTTAESPSPHSAELQLLRSLFAVIDQNLRTQLVAKLSETQMGSELLLSSIASGMPTAGVLQDERIAAQLSAHGQRFATEVERLTRDLPPADSAAEQLANTVLTKLKLGEGDASAGLMVFQKNCQNCHRRAGEGGVAGPQLDGVATRGATRMLEDILHPNRNVDIAFRTSTLVLDNGKVLTGVVRPSEKPDETLVITTEGKLTTIATESIDERKDSNLSLMPANVATQLTEPQLLNLIKYLLR